MAKRALSTAEVPSLLEPVDISRDDNQKRVDGVTVDNWLGMLLVWTQLVLRMYVDRPINRVLLLTELL